jgi:hypothetical protein
VIPRSMLRACPGGCGTAIVWAVTEAGRRQALNPEPDEAGNVAAYRDGMNTWRARTLKDGEDPWAHEKRYMPHAAVCERLRAGRPRPGSLARIEQAAMPPGVTSLTAWKAAHPRRPRPGRTPR